MTESGDRKQVLEETLKRLRQERGAQVKVATVQSAAVRAERKRVVGELATGAKTVPDLAAATGLTTDRVLWHIASLRKYGTVSESDKVGDYFAYVLAGDDDHVADTAEE